jgi:hypothetical protein
LHGLPAAQKDSSLVDDLQQWVLLYRIAPPTFEWQSSSFIDRKGCCSITRFGLLGNLNGDARRLDHIAENVVAIQPSESPAIVQPEEFVLRIVALSSAGECLIEESLRGENIEPLACAIPTVSYNCRSRSVATSLGRAAGYIEAFEGFGGCTASSASRIRHLMFV